MTKAFVKPVLLGVLYFICTNLFFKKLMICEKKLNWTLCNLEET